MSMRIINEKAWYAIGARNISLAEQIGLDMLVMCNGCVATLFKINEDLKSDAKLKGNINEILKKIGKNFEGQIQVKSLLRVLYEDIGPFRIRKKIKAPLQGLKIAVHYGCHIFEELREYDDPKKPETLQELSSSLGAEVLTYPSENMCCFAFANSIDKDFIFRALNRKLYDISQTGADCLVVICPYCFSQFELNQLFLSRRLGKEMELPVFFYLELLGLAMGLNAYEIGLQHHKINAIKMLNRLEIARTTT